MSTYADILVLITAEKVTITRYTSSVLFSSRQDTRGLVGRCHASLLVATGADGWCEVHALCLLSTLEHGRRKMMQQIYSFLPVQTDAACTRSPHPEMDPAMSGPRRKFYRTRSHLDSSRKVEKFSTAETVFKPLVFLLNSHARRWDARSLLAQQNTSHSPCYYVSRGSASL
ncbi:hypothetical protein RRG08_027898 [Elysia crispata]|uniref:Uncharacterized protein n=1 Tax=Elysia crispata TaxID=231223 RepID=A0AAE1A7E8_9GAST|nr:hypothetical protein RRG08_027898 [Elysia crispata]